MEGRRRGKSGERKGKEVKIVCQVTSIFFNSIQLKTSVHDTTSNYASIDGGREGLGC